MRLRFATLAFVIGLSATATPFESSTKEQTRRTDEKLELSTTVVGEEYCAKDHLRLRLRYRFRNTGTESILLYKDSHAVAEYFVSRTLEDAAQHKYVENVEPFIQPILPDPTASATPDENLLATIKSGEAFETEHDFHLFVFDGRPESEDNLRAGNYFLELVVPTWWFGGPDKAKTARQRWRQFGYLFSDDLTSIPMPFTIKDKPQVVKCVPH